METLRIDVKGWPENYVKLVKSYAEQVRKAVVQNGEEAERISELPIWAGISLPPQDIRKAAYGGE